MAPFTTTKATSITELANLYATSLECIKQSIIIDANNELYLDQHHLINGKLEGGYNTEITQSSDITKKLDNLLYLEECITMDNNKTKIISLTATAAGNNSMEKLQENLKSLF